jgi:beta-galactosidase
LKVVAYRDGKTVATDERKTAGAPARIVLQADRNAIQSDGDDLSFITVRVEDKDGNLCPLADNLVHFHLDGPATIAAVDNGNAATVETFQADYRKAFSGLALLIVRGKRGQSGRVGIVASSDGLQSAETKVEIRAPGARASK